MLVKVCGIKFPDNLKDVALTSPDAIGLIFYSASPRHAGSSILPADIELLPASILKVGVFVDEEVVNILKISDRYHLDMVQLHGDESPAYCDILRSYGIDIIKAFRVDDSFDFSITGDYSPECSFFLFDARGRYNGGNGISFNWECLRRYKGSTPFLLSGGINVESTRDIRLFTHSMMAGLDLNSGFETEPGRKDAALIREFIKTIR